MYIPRHFSVTDTVAIEFLSELRSGHLVISTDVGIKSAFIPIHFRSSTNSIIGHLARGNELWALKTNQESLMISSTMDSYISPTWYQSKIDHGRVVPTWDYMLAHVYGELIIHDDVNWLKEAVSELTDVFEGNRIKPWKLDDAPDDYVAGQLRAIVGFELKVSRIEVSFKMSQNKSDLDLNGVIDGLNSEGKSQISKRIAELTPKNIN